MKKILAVTQIKLCLNHVVVLIKKLLPLENKDKLGDFYSGCVLGASSVNELELMLQESGFTQISIEPKDESKEFIKD